MAKFKNSCRRYESIFDDRAESWAKADGQKAIVKVWDDYKKTKTAYRNYKIVVGVKVGLAAVGVIAGVTAAATSAAGNVTGLVVGSIAAAKAFSKGAQVLRSYGKSASQVFDQVVKDVKELEENYQDMSKKYSTLNTAKVTGNEVMKKAIEQLTTVSMNTIKGCESKIGEFRTKLSLVEKEAHKAARELNVLLDSADDIEAAIKKSNVESVVADLKADLKKAEDSVAAAIETVSDLVDKVKKGKHGAKILEARLKELGKHLSTGVFMAATFVIIVADVGASIWGSAGGPESIDQFLAASSGKWDQVGAAFETVAEKTTDWVSTVKV